MIDNLMQLGIMVCFLVAIIGGLGICAGIVHFTLWIREHLESRKRAKQREMPDRIRALG